jgi:hypothetical protein
MLFKLDYSHFIIPLKWHNKLTTNDIELNSFIYDLNKLIRSSCKIKYKYTIDKKYQEHDFWKILMTLRNTNAHSPTEGAKLTEAMRNEQNRSEAYELLIDKHAPDPNLQVDSIKLLEYCNEFLDEIIGDL